MKSLSKRKEVRLRRRILNTFPHPDTENCLLIRINNLCNNLRKNLCIFLLYNTSDGECINRQDDVVETDRQHFVGCRWSWNSTTITFQ
ncbi:hypothetical protein AR158_c403L [Paramecium bursaria Chlorella virus AR158]|uniref:hypothetical protein n=1 Tax=Paramecium bursaria Chlorella virus AR158 TaxID=380598 RepID=UPI00015AA6BB|nr:hypothetical protein AR158_c403L [Paramecium bursaria Chlorella virus AR158]ABU43948.1 hypothetical protein AR158_c403L [Paramecium bursaria Chlorella virus AR158]